MRKGKGAIEKKRKCRTSGKRGEPIPTAKGNKERQKASEMCRILSSVRGGRPRRLPSMTEDGEEKKGGLSDRSIFEGSAIFGEREKKGGRKDRKKNTICAAAREVLFGPLLYFTVGKRGGLGGGGKRRGAPKACLASLTGKWRELLLS